MNSARILACAPAALLLLLALPDSPVDVEQAAPPIPELTSPVIVTNPSSDEEEIKRTIIASFAYSNKNLKTQQGEYSKHGALEFWSSGGLMNEIPAGALPFRFDAVNLHPKHIKVVILVEGQAAVAHYYSEGSMKPAGSSVTDHYLTRVTQVFVKEDGKWRVRSSHWSALTGGGGTTQTALDENN